MAVCANLNLQLRLHLDPVEDGTVAIAMFRDQLRTADLALLSASCQQAPAGRMAAAPLNNPLQLPLPLPFPLLPPIHRVFTLIGSVFSSHLSRHHQLP